MRLRGNALVIKWENKQFSAPIKTECISNDRLVGNLFFENENLLISLNHLVMARTLLLGK